MLLNVSVAVEIGERISEIGQIVCKLIRTTFNWWDKLNSNQFYLLKTLKSYPTRAAKVWD